MSTMTANLKDTLTADLFHFVVDCRIPFSKTEPLDFVQVGQNIFASEYFGKKIQDRVWPVLKTLSRIGLDNMPDMMDFLPPPTDPDFATQCLGLQLILDQAPRALCSSESTDGRYVNSYFDPISQRLVDTWLPLPAHLRPDSWTNRKDDMSLDYWILLRPPSGEGVTATTWSWWMLMLMDVHKPIIDRFGRYPYRNAIEGLDSTDEELEWIRKTDHFGEAPPDVAQKVKKDIAHGRWTPLGGS
ncbi:hypothetical protein C8R45DRAFT_1215352 [Mycena sanguinolenta]|nr:hypothetical protein C8R45DRAFT_1215352 [Mycena sanguinolenta]